MLLGSLVHQFQHKIVLTALQAFYLSQLPALWVNHMGKNWSWPFRQGVKQLLNQTSTTPGQGNLPFFLMPFEATKPLLLFEGCLWMWTLWIRSWFLSQHCSAVGIYLLSVRICATLAHSPLLRLSWDPSEALTLRAGEGEEMNTAPGQFWMG